ncbi:MAG: hypothetical protein WCK63_18290, partial [Betaproteobacteria bacterium]
MRQVRIGLRPSDDQPQRLLVPSRFQENDRQGIQGDRVGRCDPQNPSEERLGLSGLPCHWNVTAVISGSSWGAAGVWGGLSCDSRYP